MKNGSDLEKILRFLQEAEKLKTVLRHSWLSTSRQESDSDHSWRAALFAMILAPYLGKKVNVEKVIKMLLIHDLAEIEVGDFPAWKGRPPNKHNLEKAGLKKLIKQLPKKSNKEIFKLWLEYEELKSTEAKFAQTCDKLETIDQHNLADIKTWVKEEYQYNLVHGTEEVRFSKVLQELKKLIDKESRAKIAKK